MGITYVIPCVKSEFLLVLQMIRSAHCTITILTKNAVWQVYSRILRWSKVCKKGEIYTLARSPVRNHFIYKSLGRFSKQQRQRPQERDQTKGL